MGFRQFTLILINIKQLEMEITNQQLIHSASRKKIEGNFKIRICEGFLID